VEQDKPPLEIPAFSISARVTRKTITKDISKAIKAEIGDSLNGLPVWIIDRVHR